MVILVRLTHHENAFLPILVTLLGMVMLVKLVQPENAQSPMVVIPSGSTLVLQPVNSVFVEVSIRQLFVL